MLLRCGMNDNTLKLQALFYGWLTVLLLLTIGLGVLIYALLPHFPMLSLILIVQAMNSLGCYIVIGLGLGFPLVALACILGWVHLVLLMSGHIDPHLAGEGFFKVLYTLFSKI